MRVFSAVLVFVAAAATANAVELDVSPIVGGQLLERKDSGLSHGALQDEVTLGRSVLGGLALGVRWGARHHLAAEGVIGPYHDDVDRSCIRLASTGLDCSPSPYVTTRFAVHYGLQYSFVLRRHGTSPFLGTGIGAKHYAYDRLGDPSYRSASFTWNGALGVEGGEFLPVRLEGRLVVVWRNPYLWYLNEGYGTGSSRQYELQLRLSVRVPVLR